MTFYVIKTVMTVVLIVIISEIAKRNTFAGALLTSIPLISVFVILWLYFETKDTARISTLATSIFWLVLPSLVFFITLPIFLKQGINFYLSVCASCGLTVASYGIMILILNHFGIKL